MNNTLKTILREYGLSDKEAAIYLAVLTDSGITIKALAEKTRINRTTLYPIAEGLLRRGVLAQFKGRRGVQFVAAEPSALLQKIEYLKKSFTEALPEFAALERRSPRTPRVRYYQGREGYLSVLADTLAAGVSEIRYLGSAQKLNDVVSEKYIEQVYIPTRVAKGISFRQLVLDDAFSRKLVSKDAHELRMTKFLPSTSRFSANIIIYGDKVAYCTSEKELTCVLIESAEIAEIEHNSFQLLWDSHNVVTK